VPPFQVLATVPFDVDNVLPAAKPLSLSSLNVTPLMNVPCEPVAVAYVHDVPLEVTPTLAGAEFNPKPENSASMQKTEFCAEA
jgi:hypothetical protein